MPTLPTQSFNTIVSNTIAGIQGRAAKLINFSQGSSLRALVEGFAGLFLWFQALVLQLLTAIRLSTSTGVDVDTFTADFMPTVGTSNGVASPRLGAQAASGTVLLTRLTAGANTVFIPVGSTFVTNDGNNTVFAVVANTTYPTYSATPSPGGYTLAAYTASITVPVLCNTAGTIGNVQPGTIAFMTSPITGIDLVTNSGAFTNGANQESDVALKQRFQLYILGLSRGDYYGTAAAIASAAITAQWTLTENYTFTGAYSPGFYCIVADDGSGSPSAAFLATITNAVNAVRPLGCQFTVFAPTVVLANIGMVLTTNPAYVHSVVVAQVVALLNLNINALGLGVSLSWSQIAAWAYSVAGVTLVSNITLNGASGDGSNIATTKLTNDGKGTINYISIKPGVMSIS
jgi:uncharacterized phage protein gp47/JayE